MVKPAESKDLTPAVMIHRKNKFTPWLEFEGIPQPELKGTNLERYESLVELPFLGKPSTSGENLRFVDLHWADVMQQNETAVLQKVELWAQGLLVRLRLKHQFANKSGKSSMGILDRIRHSIGRLKLMPKRLYGKKLDNSGLDVPAWILHILGTLVKFLVFLRRLMHFRFGEMEDMLFVKFLGDVQQYGEFPFCRWETPASRNALLS